MQLTIYLSVCPSACLPVSACLSARLYICAVYLSLSPSIDQSINVSVYRFSKVHLRLQLHLHTIMLLRYCCTHYEYVYQGKRI